MTWLWLVMGLLALAGILDTVYVLRFTFQPQAVARDGKDAACRLDDPGHCQTLFQSPTARLVAGIPNSALGFIFYGVVLLTALANLSGIMEPPVWWLALVLLGAFGAVLMSFYLLYNLLVVRQTTCIPCFIGQGINLLLFVGLLSLVLEAFTKIV